MTKKLILLLIISLTCFPDFAKENQGIEKGKIYQTETHLFNESKGWQHQNTSNPKSLFIGFYSNIITINEKDPIKIECEPLKTITDNDELDTQEADAILTYLDSDIKRKCRVSFSYYKKSGLRVLHIFFIKEKWLSFYFSIDSKISEIKSNDWELASLTLPNQRIKMKDFEVKYLKLDDSRIDIENSASYRAAVGFSENGVDILIYDKKGIFVKGFGLYGEKKMQVQKNDLIQKSYSTGKIGSEYDYSKVDISITWFPYSGYSILMAYSRFVDKKEIEGVVVSKESKNEGFSFRLF